MKGATMGLCEEKNVEYPKDHFFAAKGRDFVGLTYDDVIMPPEESDINPEDAILTSWFSRNVPLLVPISSSPMSSVTRVKMAEAMAREGGIGILDPSLPLEEMKASVERVKHALNWRVGKPITVRPNQTLLSLLNLIEDKGYKFKTFPVVDDEYRLIGLITGRHFKHYADSSRKHIKTIMAKQVVTAKPSTTIDQARRIMKRRDVDVLPLVDQSGKLVGMYLWDDVQRYFDEEGKKHRFNVDSKGNLRVGVAVGMLDDAFKYADFLNRASRKPDVYIVDTSHGHKNLMFETVRELKRQWPEIDVVAGNIATAEAARFLVKAGADGIRVGFGPGSICTTRILTGTGVPQITAVNECSSAIRGSGAAVIADGGIKFPGDVGKAIAAGADCVMLGNKLAGCDEAPGEEKLIKGVRYKLYYGMGSEKSLKNMRAARKRYSQKKDRPIIPEGVEGRVLCTGPVSKTMEQLEGGLRATMKNLGARTIGAIQCRAKFIHVMAGGQREAHPSVEGIEETVNYKPEA